MLSRTEDIVDANKYYIVKLLSIGDIWIDRGPAIHALYNAPADKKILLDFGWQGFSIEASELSAFLDEYLAHTGRPRSDIEILSPNRLEDLAYKNHYMFDVCDEFLRCGNYWVDTVQHVPPSAKRFGYMVGRDTVPRMKMFYDLDRYDLSEHFFLSKLNNPWAPEWENGYVKTLSLDSWFDDENQTNQFLKWYSTLDIPSFDGLDVDSQYHSDYNARLNSANQYQQSHIDLVFESLTLGKTFAPTEKLVRSLITKKPFIVYASQWYLANLHLMGFKTFGHLWDEGYDRLHGVDRYNAILALIKQLANMPKAEFCDLTIACQDVCQHNREILRKMNVDFHKTEQFFNLDFEIF